MDPWQVLGGVFGELTWEHSQRTRPVTAPDEVYRATVVYRGRGLRIVRTWGRSQTSTDRTIWRWSTALQVEVGPVPLRLSLSPHFVAWPKISTGDAAFEEHYRLGGAPAELLQRAFDADLRARLSAMATLRPFIELDGKSFWMGISDVVEQGRGDVDQARQMADLFVAVVDRVCAELDRSHAAVLADRGPEAAAAWRHQQASAVAAVEERRGRIKVFILLGVAAFVVGICVMGLLITLASIGLLQ